VLLYVELTGMVKWVMVGHDAFAAAEAGIPESQRLKTAEGSQAAQASKGTKK